jgi:CheY-like chemotaxis protein
MKVLIAEDDKDTATFYKKALDERGHQVVITNNGQRCLDNYHEELQNVTFNSNLSEHIQPFDAVILDYKMAKINGMEVAKEILAINPRQRIIFVSAYVKETLIDAVQQLKQPVELLQKPFEQEVLVDAIEDKVIYSQLQRLDINVQDIKRANLRHEQLMKILDILTKLRKKK